MRKNITIKMETINELVVGNFDQRKALALLPMPAEILNKLSLSPEWEIRCLVAKNPNTDSKTFERLSEDPDSRVKKEVCKK